MRLSMMAAALAALGSAGAFAALPPAQVEAAEGVCALSGWSIDPDPAGLNVRAGPSASAPVVGRLPPPERTEEYDRPFGTEFDLVEARDGWFRIARPVRWSGDRTRASGLPSGWVSGRHVGFALRTDIAFAAPDPASPVVATAWRDADGVHPLGYRHPTACRGEWVRLMITGQDGREREAWVRGVCGIQESTCDGVRGDLIE